MIHHIDRTALRDDAFDRSGIAVQERGEIRRVLLEVPGADVLFGYHPTLTEGIETRKEALACQRRTPR